VSPEGRPVRSGGRAMNEILDRSAGNGRPARGAAAVIEPSEVEGVTIRKLASIMRARISITRSWQRLFRAAGRKIALVSR